MTPDGDGEVVIGLEVHAYVATESKLYCPCSARFLTAEPNTNVCPICTGQPGAKPMAPNREALGLGLRLAQALGCAVSPALRVLRKHYFYPDLPSNYQRTSQPFATGGELRGVRIREIHLEEDPGAYELAEGVVDYNRSGVPLLEVVTEPDIRSPGEARAFVNALREALAFLGVGRAEAGVKADANLSLPGGERAEVKNVNSARNVERALAHEAQRQRALVAGGGEVARETRHFDEKFGTTVSLRVKETEADYRYLPDPDLPPAPITGELVAEYAPDVTPGEARARITGEAGVDGDAAGVLLGERGLYDAYVALSGEVPPGEAFKFLSRDLKGELEYRGQGLAESRATVEGLRALVGALHRGDVTPRVATRLLRGWLDGEHALQPALRREVQASEGVDVAQAARDAVAANPQAVADYRSGKAQALNFLMGQAMRKLKGRGQPEEVREAVRAALEEGRE